MSAPNSSAIAVRLAAPPGTLLNRAVLRSMAVSLCSNTPRTNPRVTKVMMMHPAGRITFLSSKMVYSVILEPMETERKTMAISLMTTSGSPKG